MDEGSGEEEREFWEGSFEEVEGKCVFVGKLEGEGYLVVVIDVGEMVKG